MSKRANKPPAPIVRKIGAALSPASAYDAEALDGFPQGTEFDCIPRTRRSDRQLRTYWKTLGMVVKATGRWPTAEVLHTALKIELGRTVPITGFDGEVIGHIPDSVALDAMPHAEFCLYMDQAMTRLSEAVGWDVMEWMQ